MKYFIKYPILLLALLYMAGCASVRHQPTTNVFSFEYENSTYEIIGITSEEGESVNFLVQSKNDSNIFRVIDYDQDGILDRVITGSIDLEEANKIYQEGIRQAVEQDRFRELEIYREYLITHEEYRLVIQSFSEGKDGYQNRFFIYEPDWIVVGIFWDDEADGTLSRIERGEMNLEYAQQLYDLILERAAEENRIDERFEDQFIITKDKPIENFRNALESSDLSE